MNRCPNCFRPWDGQICAFCAYHGEESAVRGVLAAGTLLCEDQYELGLALMSSRQAIAYAALDRRSEELVLITEFYPKGIVERAADGRTVQVRRNQALYAEACDAYLTGRQGQALPLAASFRGNGTVYRVHQAAGRQELPQTLADQLLDTPVLFRDSRGRPSMSINALFIPDMPPRRDYRPAAAVVSRRRKKRLVAGICLAAAVAAAGLGTGIALQAVKQNQVTVRLQTFGLPVQAQLRQGEEILAAEPVEQAEQGETAVYVFAVHNGDYVFEAYGEDEESRLSQAIKVRSEDIEVDACLVTPAPIRLTADEWLFQCGQAAQIISTDGSRAVDGTLAEEGTAVFVRVDGLEEGEALTLRLRNANHAEAIEVTLRSGENQWRLSPGTYELLLAEGRPWMRWTVGDEAVEQSLSGQDAKLMTACGPAFDRLQGARAAVLDGKAVLPTGDAEEKALLEALTRLQRQYPDSYLSGISLREATLKVSTLIQPEGLDAVALLDEQDNRVVSLTQDSHLLLSPGTYRLALVLRDGRSVAEGNVTVTDSASPVITVDDLARQWLTSADVWRWGAEGEALLAGPDAAMLTGQAGEELPVYPVTVTVPAAVDDPLYLLRGADSLTVAPAVEQGETRYTFTASAGEYQLSLSADGALPHLPLSVKDQASDLTVAAEQLGLTQAKALSRYDGFCVVMAEGGEAQVYAYDSKEQIMALLSGEEAQAYLAETPQPSEMVTLMLTVEEFERSFKRQQERPAQGTYWLLWYEDGQEASDQTEQTMQPCIIPSRGIPLPAPNEEGNIQVRLKPGDCQVLFVEDAKQGLMYISPLMEATPYPKNSNRSYILGMAGRQEGPAEPLCTFHYADEPALTAVVTPTPTPALTTTPAAATPTLASAMPTPVVVTPGPTRAPVAGHVPTPTPTPAVQTSVSPTDKPTEGPTEKPTDEPTDEPTEKPSDGSENGSENEPVEDSGKGPWPKPKPDPSQPSTPTDPNQGR